MRWDGVGLAALAIAPGFLATPAGDCGPSPLGVENGTKARKPVRTGWSPSPPVVKCPT